MTLDDIRSAQKTLSGVSRLTALEGSRYLSGLVGAPVHFKCENLQRTGSFKLRGGYVRIAGLSPEERAAGVVAASAGNHAQGVALAASLLGVRSTVFMPEGAPLPKIAATRDYGAEVRLCGQIVDETMRAAKEYAERTGAVFIHPFDHPDI
ncbi:pyridoxal-phosphate dependent enzyme, partial [Streptomyces sp. MK37H]|nr:pyridoxal-phosphate dependent enzyme [Streptomyces sp. MK37H]